VRQEDLPFHKANKHPLGEWLVGRIVMQGGLRRAFGTVYARIDPAALRVRDEAKLPLIFCATHSGWWDGHIAYILNRRVFRRDAYLMMEEQHLARYPFFTWVGVFGVARDDPRRALQSVRYITEILSTGSNRALWVFPQGAMAHPEARPITIFGGAANIARRLGRCALLPVALRYDFLLEQAPHAFAYVGSPILVGGGESNQASSELTSYLRDAMVAAAERLRQDVTKYDLGRYRRVLSGRGSVDVSWDRVRALFGRAGSREG